MVILYWKVTLGLNSSLIIQTWVIRSWELNLSLTINNKLHISEFTSSVTSATPFSSVFGLEALLSPKLNPSAALQNIKLYLSSRALTTIIMTSGLTEVFSPSGTQKKKCSLNHTLTLTKYENSLIMACYWSKSIWRIANFGNWSTFARVFMSLYILHGSWGVLTTALHYQTCMHL